jgi:hypothetical protein
MIAARHRQEGNSLHLLAFAGPAGGGNFAGNIIEGMII